MSNKKKLIKKEVIEQDYESSDDDQIELPKKEIKKKPFVMTEKRKNPWPECWLLEKKN